ncbi:deoxyribodipyrimidine photo-lyase [Halobacteriales archaeon SW_5_70_135]|nr:MAG: deoxyribodipyrimidine photo-lyase [Halobacteriales archaeon SW_5_70_135]
MAIHWHRRDLRAPDNVGLAAAAGVGWPADDGTGGEAGVVPLFVFDDTVLEHGSPPRVTFMLDALDSLRTDYRERGGDLLIERGDPREVLVRVAAEHGHDRVVWNRTHSGLGRERDDDVREQLEGEGVAVDTYEDDLLHEPGSITTNAGDYYSVYTYFWKKWRDRPKDDPAPAPEGEEIALDPGAGGAVPTLGDLGFEKPEADVEPAGTAQARERLSTFCESDVFRYDEAREHPAEDATSRLSAHLTWGTIGPREVYWATDEAHGRADGEEEREAVEEFQSQLAWREFYTHVLHFEPQVVTENYKSYEHEIEWRSDREGLQAWKDGETGYPIVDAGMRQLRQEAYMHNRVRMIVASFLTKDLLIDWRAGYDWFRRRLADHDTANDNGGWQWAASTGTDAQPYFRIFNPMTQGERYDPDARYVKEYVPELRSASADAVHSWHELSPAERERQAPDYPAPVVDHSERREEALEMYQRARGDGD